MHEDHYLGLLSVKDAENCEGASCCLYSPLEEKAGFKDDKPTPAARLRKVQTRPIKPKYLREL